MIIKNKSNAVIEIEGIKIYPGDNIPINIGYTPHLRNLEKIGVIGISKQEERYKLNTSKESNIEYPKSSVQDKNIEVKDRIDISKIDDSIPIKNEQSDTKVVQNTNKRSKRNKSTV